MKSENRKKMKKMMMFLKTDWQTSVITVVGILLWYSIQYAENWIWFSDDFDFRFSFHPDYFRRNRRRQEKIRRTNDRNRFQNVGFWSQSTGLLEAVRSTRLTRKSESPQKNESQFFCDAETYLFEAIELDGIVISIYWILCKYSLNINEWFWMLGPFI